MPSSVREAWKEKGVGEEQQIAPGPDYDFKTFQPTRFHRCHTLDFNNGLRVQRKPILGIGGDRLVQDLLIDGLPDEEEQERRRGHESEEQTSYGQSRPKSAPAFRPRFCTLDKKVLRFFATFGCDLPLQLQCDRNSNSRERNVQILYFLEDDTISVIEPRIKNSGLFQGLLLRRHRIPHLINHDDPLLQLQDGVRVYWHWTDLAIGKDVEFYGRVYHIHSCDEFSRKYLLSEGIKQLEDSPAATADKEGRPELKRCEAGSDIRRESKLKKYLENDGKVLRFFCKSDLPKYPLGQSGEKEFILHFYLADDTIEIRELRTEMGDKALSTAAGAKLLRRQRLPKYDFTNRSCDFPSAKRFEKEAFFAPSDFVVGQDVMVLNRRFRILSCDDFTSRYLKVLPGREVERQGGGGERCRLEAPRITTLLPPHTQDCIGDPMDSMQNCLKLLPKPLRKDQKKFLAYSGMTLRYEAKISSPWPFDARRRFVFNYFPADDTFNIHEVRTENSGGGGKYLCRGKVAKPVPKVSGEPDFYNVEDFYIGSILRIHGRNFEIVGADERVLKYIDERKCPLPIHCELSLRNYFREKKMGIENDSALILPVRADC